MRSPLRDPLPLILVTLSAFATWLFVIVARSLSSAGNHAWDEWALLALRVPGDPAEPLGPPWVEEMMRDLTALGGATVTTLVVLAAVFLLAAQGRRKMAGYLVVTVVGAACLNGLLKESIDRPRPDLVPHGVPVYSSSFPSGHSMTAAATYLTLGVIASRRQPRVTTRLLVMLSVCAIGIAVGLSRVYLGVHWPTDVLAGWAAGSAWALLCWLVADRFDVLAPSHLD